MMRPTLALLGLLALAFATPALAAGPNGQAVFDALKGLSGDWTTKDAEGNVTPVTFSVVSGGSAILEQMGGHQGPDMVTVYHRDGEGMLMTHYCAVGNQPRMRLTSISPDGRTFGFTLVDVSNLKAPGDGHMKSVTYTLMDADHFAQEWTFASQGKDEPHKFVWERKK